MFNALEKGYIWIFVMEILYPDSILSHVFVKDQHPAKEILSCKCYDVIVICFMASATNTQKYVSCCFWK